MAPALHAATWPSSLPLLAVVTLGTVGAAVLLGLAFAAVVRRQSRPYLLVFAAVTALFARSAVVALALTGAVTSAGHHLLEHSLDAVLVALVIAAVYHARTTPDDLRSPDS